MTILFILNAAFELLVAVLSVVVFKNLLLAGNAIGLTTLSALLINQSEPKILRIGLLTFAVFHTAITLAWIITAVQGGGFNPAAIGHGLFALAFWTFVLR